MKPVILALLLAAAGCGGGPSQATPPRCGAIPTADTWRVTWEPPFTTDGGVVGARAVVRAGPIACQADGVTPGLNLKAVSGPAPYSGTIAFATNDCGATAGCGSGCIISGTFPTWLGLAPGQWTFRGVLYCLTPDGGGYVTYPNDADLVVALP